jgi:hypothetical protein
MRRTRFIVLLLTFVVIGSMQYAPAKAISPVSPPLLAAPDLKIQQFLFPPLNDKALRVQVVNSGNAISGRCLLRLTVRKINGVAVGRETQISLPALAPGQHKWFVINAKSILPNNVALEATTFKLNADATGLVAESDESNNEVWHNL